MIMLCISSFIAELPFGSELLWFLGDNFMVKSYRNHFKKVADKDLYVKQFFEYGAFCSSRFSCANENMLSRLQNSLAAGLNQKHKMQPPLPDYIIVVLDDDLISYLDFNANGANGAATLLGSWVQWLVEEFNKLIATRLEQIPSKCSKRPFFYWVAPPLHSQFSKE